MPTVYDSSGQSYVLTEQVGRGGEGTVFACPNDYNLVAKIYHEPITDEKAEKLRWMADNGNERLLKVAAWIVDTLHDSSGGKNVGFLMPNVKAKEIHELYSLKSRRVYFPNATWQFLVHTATNVARAFYSLHKDGHVMGDVNHGNCVVLADGTVKLIDCDSYSIKKQDSRYACEVGVGTHLAPELQGVNLRDAVREEKHDNFGLAVIIFQLLFLGRHPFAGIYLGDEDKSIEQSIRELRFAYSDDAHLRQVKQPPGTLSLTQISPRLALMLERAFLTEDRPEPQEWIEALEDLTNNLKQCAAHPGHHYFQSLNACPWCAIEAQTGLMLFPFVSAAGEESFNIFTVENLIASLNIPNDLPMLPPKQTVWLPPSPEAQGIRKDIRDRLILLGAAQLIVTGIFVMIFGGCAVFIPSVIIFAFFLHSFNNYANNQKIDLEVKMDTARGEWHRLESEWGILRSDKIVEDSLAEIRKRLDDYQTLHKETRNRVKLIQDRTYHRRLDEYLNSFEIEEAKTLGFDDRKVQALRSSGIRTAADVELKKLRSIDAAGDVAAQKLIDWRKEVERNFQYKPKAEISDDEREQAEREVAETRRRVEGEINTMLVPLRSMSVKIRQQQHGLTARTSELSERLSQAKSDFESIALKIPATLAMGSIALGMVFFGNSIHSSSVEENNYRTSGGFSSAPASRDYGIGSGYGAPSGRSSGSGSGSGSPTTYSDNYKVAENLTDEQIEAMTDWERKSAAKTLEGEAAGMALIDKDYKKAEKKLRLARRLDELSLDVANRLGYVLYEQGKTEESLDVLLKARDIRGDYLTEMYISMNYLQTKRYKEARDILSFLANDYASQEVYFNLGLAHKGLKDYERAAVAFRKGLGYAPQDKDSIYELGVSLYKSGDKTGAFKQYGDLLEIDSNAAKNLKKIINGK